MPSAMKALKTLLAGAILSGLSSLALADGNPLSVHVLNLQDGLPSPAVTVTLEKKDGQSWQTLNDCITQSPASRAVSLLSTRKASRWRKAPIG